MSNGTGTVAFRGGSEKPAEEKIITGENPQKKQITEIIRERGHKIVEKVESKIETFAEKVEGMKKKDMKALPTAVLSTLLLAQLSRLRDSPLHK